MSKEARSKVTKGRGMRSGDGKRQQKSDAPTEKKSNEKKKVRPREEKSRTKPHAKSNVTKKTKTPNVPPHSTKSEARSKGSKVASNKKEGLLAPPTSPIASTPPNARTLTFTQTDETRTVSRKATSKEIMSAAVFNPAVCKPALSPTALATSPVQKWSAEPIATAWINSADFGKVKNEHLEILKMSVDVERQCKKWKAHLALNQSDEDPVLDANLAKCSDPNAYVNIVQVGTPLSRNMLLGQIPMAGTEEVFWRTVFELGVKCLYILNEEAVSFFPQVTGEFVHYGSMFVNIRRAEDPKTDILRYQVEVLPDGFSNSIIMTVTVIRNWLQHSTHGKQSVVIREVLEVINFMNTSQPDESVLIVSRFGSGRAPHFLALVIAIHKLDQRIEPNVFEIVKSIRLQRPNALGSLMQYAAIYIVLFHFIKRKMSWNADCELCKKSVQLTLTFANALEKEAAADGGKSVMMTPD